MADRHVRGRHSGPAIRTRREQGNMTQLTEHALDALSMDRCELFSIDGCGPPDLTSHEQAASAYQAAKLAERVRAAPVIELNVPDSVEECKRLLERARKLADAGELGVPDSTYAIEAAIVYPTATEGLQGPRADQARGVAHEDDGVILTRVRNGDFVVDLLTRQADGTWVMAPFSLRGRSRSGRGVGDIVPTASEDFKARLNRQFPQTAAATGLYTDRVSNWLLLGYWTMMMALAELNAGRAKVRHAAARPDLGPGPAISAGEARHRPLH